MGRNKGASHRCWVVKGSGCSRMPGSGYIIPERWIAHTRETAECKV